MADEVPSDNLGEEVQQLWTVPCADEKVFVKAASRFAILADDDDELQFVQHRLRGSTASALSRRGPRRSEVSIDRGAVESVWPISLLNLIPTLKIVG